MLLTAVFFNKLDGNRKYFNFLRQMFKMANKPFPFPIIAK